MHHTLNNLTSAGSLLVKYVSEEPTSLAALMFTGLMSYLLGVPLSLNHVIVSFTSKKGLTRGKLEEQKMADLPLDRLTMDPPFTNVGLDVFGPWTI